MVIYRGTVCTVLQVEVRWKERGPGAAGPGGALAQKKLLQYKVHDKGVSFFARGTSSAVL